MDRNRKQSVHKIEPPAHRESPNSNLADKGRLSPSRATNLVETDRNADELDFVLLNDGSLAEVVEDPSNSARTLLAVCKNGQVSYADTLTCGGETLVPLRRDHRALRRMILPRGAKSYRSVDELLYRVVEYLSSVVVLTQESLETVATWVLCTWVVDCFHVAPYLSVYGYPQSGKTTLLQALRLVCRRPLLVGNIDSTGLLRACSQLQTTLLIDETDMTKENLLRLLRMGVSREVCTVGEHENRQLFGMKAFSTVEPLGDAALNSRCIIIPMTESNQRKRVDLTDQTVLRATDSLRARLLQYRFENYRQLRWVRVPGSERLRPRDQDLLGCLAAPFAGNSDRCQVLLAMLASQNAMRQESLPHPHDVVLRVLYQFIHVCPNCESVTVGQLAKTVNKELSARGRGFRLHPRKVGAALKSLGIFSRLRTREGWIIWLDQKAKRKIHELTRRYGNGGEGSYLLIASRNCQYCQRAEDSAQAQREQQTTKAKRRRKRKARK